MPKITQPLPKFPNRSASKLHVNQLQTNCKMVLFRVTTLQTMWNSLTVRGTRHVECYSHHACTSVTVSSEVHDPKPYI